jgi:undecaprenyl diphosphate synthase
MMVNYSGRREIVDAVKRIVHEGVQAVDEKSFGKFLYVPDAPEPDLIIRTSGEKRISNFYLWQAAYSELYFTTVLFPDFEKYHLYRALIDYSNRKRRFGGLKEF